MNIAVDGSTGFYRQVRCERLREGEDNLIVIAYIDNEYACIGNEVKINDNGKKLQGKYFITSIDKNILKKSDITFSKAYNRNTFAEIAKKDH